ncbi:hypothetical protein D8674_017480 [Pyrus ussuriensis x Pyrus communis]|uniref:Uncharacterized protein n=1 Tax=Pyrus ussuriensis x Pyrus communis TaxID=2448454 RepID=A0A5N5HJY8_9ROSA|nr:hypothetical protein D8674_017480 [Pyrus ussuriensis x Pyrus communis]
MQLAYLRFVKSIDHKSFELPTLVQKHVCATEQILSCKVCLHSAKPKTSYKVPFVRRSRSVALKIHQKLELKLPLNYDFLFITVERCKYFKLKIEFIYCIHIGTSADGYQPKVTELYRRASIDIFVKVAGYLDCAVRHDLPQLPIDCKRNLPIDLAEGVLGAPCLQALGQVATLLKGTDLVKCCILFFKIYASEMPSFTIKHKLGCEMVKYWQQAQDNIMNLPSLNGWGEKHRLFVKWKYVEAKVSCTFCSSFLPPAIRIVSMRVTRKPKDASSKVRINRDLYSHEKIMETAPTLPDFALALKPEEFQLPPVDPS